MKKTNKNKKTNKKKTTKNKNKSKNKIKQQILKSSFIIFLTLKNMNKKYFLECK